MYSKNSLRRGDVSLNGIMKHYKLNAFIAIHQIIGSLFFYFLSKSRNNTLLTTLLSLFSILHQLY